MAPVEATDRALAEEDGVDVAEVGGSNSTSGDATSEGLPVAALHHLAQLVRILEAPSKGQMCLACTCGGTDAKLEDRAAACVNPGSSAARAWEASVSARAISAGPSRRAAASAASRTACSLDDRCSLSALFKFAPLIA